MEIAEAACTDPVILNQWHVISALDEIAAGVVNETLLLDERVSFTTTPDGEFLVWRSSASLPVGAPVDAAKLTASRLCRSSRSTDTSGPASEIRPTTCSRLPSTTTEAAQHERRQRRRATSAPRTVENFLDLAHFPYIHEGSLGVLPHTEVVEYDLKVSTARSTPPSATHGAQGRGQLDAPVVMRYRYRVPHPYCVMLYYDSLPDPSIEDICAIWVQPMTAELVRAHNYMGVIDDTSSDTEIKPTSC